ncbi:MAG: hypothetical protein E7348_04685 [Clostridiales bacterium]|nr:hypothetical protein [Clostridiales bacterium]
MKNKIILILSLILMLCCMGIIGCSVADEVPTGDPHTITIQQSEHGTLTVDKKTARKNEKVTVTATPNKVGYQFNSYEVNGELHFASKPTFKMLGEDVVIVPNFGPTQYRIKYILSWANGEDWYSTPGFGDYDYTVLEEKDLPVAEKDGYDFMGWYRQDNPDVVFKKITPGLMVGDAELYPKFEPTVYTIDYVMPEGATHDNRSSYTVEDEDFTLTEPVYENHHFLGWCTDSNLEYLISEIKTENEYYYTLYPKFYSEIYDDEGYRLITSKTDFEYLLTDATEPIEGKYRLTTDLDLSSERVSQWFGPKDYSIRCFEGEFDGGNHTIKNNNFFVSYTSQKGLFQEIDGATIKNVRFEIDETVEHESDYYKAFVGIISTATGNNVIENVHIDKLHLTLTSNTRYTIGGILALSEEGTTTITGCSVKDVKISASLTKLGYGNFDVGGIIGYGNDVQISRSSVTFESDDYISVSAGSTSDSSIGVGISVGGMAGVVNGINDSYVYMNKGSFLSLYVLSDNINEATIGGMAGSTGNLNNCYACVTELRLISQYSHVASLRAYAAGLTGSPVIVAKNCFLTAPSGLLTIKTGEGIIYYKLITSYNIDFNAGVLTTSHSNQTYGELSELYSSCTIRNVVSDANHSISTDYLNDYEKVTSSTSSTVFNRFKSKALWDFENVWKIDENVNDGLPSLR